MTNIYYLTRTRIRRDPSINAFTVTVVDTGATGMLLNDVPVLANGLAWYNVQVGDMAGWSAQLSNGVALFKFISILETFSDETLLALLIAGEAIHQPMSGRVAVAMTVIERLRRGRAYYGLTLREIMLKPFQYSVFNEPTYYTRFIAHIPAQSLLAQLALEGLLASPCPTATHYHAEWLRPFPDWSQPQYSKFLLQIGDHLFYDEF